MTFSDDPNADELEERDSPSRNGESSGSIPPRSGRSYRLSADETAEDNGSSSRSPDRRVPSRNPREASRSSGYSPSSSQALAPRRVVPRDRYSGAEGRPRGYTGSPGSPPPVDRRPASSTASQSLSPSSWTVVFLVAVVAFFGGFVTRNVFSTTDSLVVEEKTINPEAVPPVLRDFCYSYNGLASFTVVELTSVSALTMASVPIVKLDTCSIPVAQTANALQALGIEKRAYSIGPQLGGSNLTLITIPLGANLAQSIYTSFPALAANSDGSSRSQEQVIQQLEKIINDTLTSNISGLNLQNLAKTNIPDVYVMIPGHSFNLQPQLRSQ